MTSWKDYRSKTNRIMRFMNEVRLDLVQYDDLNNRIRTKTERINALE